MLRTYKGRYERGRIILQDHEQISMPDIADIIITVLDEDILSTQESDENRDSLSAKQKEVALSFLKAVQDVRSNGFDSADEAAIIDFQSGKYKPMFDVRQQ